jgi:excisionase family DNA binding protein
MSAAVDVLADELLERIIDRPELLDRLAAKLADRCPTEPDRWLRGAAAIAEYLGCSTSRVYSLTSARRLPVEHDGAAVCIRTSTLDEWVRSGGDRCPAGGRQ